LFFDVLPEETLSEMPVLIAATGGTERHSLVLEHALRPMFSYLDFLFLSYHGRIGRGAYWLGTLVVLIAEIGAIAFLLKLSHGSLADLAAARREAAEVSREVLVHVIVPVTIVSLLFLYPTYALYAKRWHDRNKSGWWSLIGFVPLIGGLWLLIELGFLGGDEGENDYGGR